MPQTTEDINLECQLQDNCCNIYTGVYSNLHLSEKVQMSMKLKKGSFKNLKSLLWKSGELSGRKDANITLCRFVC